MDFKKHTHINGIKHSSRNKITLQLHVDGHSATTWRSVSNNAEMKKQHTNNVLFMAYTC